MFTRVSVLFLKYLVETNCYVVQILRGTWGMALNLRRTGYVTEHWNTQIEDVVWLNMPIRITSGFQIMTLRKQKERSCKAQKMFKVQQPKTKTKTKQRGIVLFRRKTRWTKINRMKIKDKTKNKQGKKIER